MVIPKYIIIPSMACPASCSYCFGPNKGPNMTMSVLQDTVRFIKRINPKNSKVDITFHGGEPLVLDITFWQKCLKLIYDNLPDQRINLHMQSNLWFLNAELAELFRDYNLKVSTSLDGPRKITETTRGREYFERTMDGINIARKYDLFTGAIATFTNQTIHHWKKVIRFFKENDIPVSIHPAIQPLGKSLIPDRLSPNDYLVLVKNLLYEYLNSNRNVVITSLNHLCQSLYSV